MKSPRDELSSHAISSDTTVYFACYVTFPADDTLNYFKFLLFPRNKGFVISCKLNKKMSCAGKFTKIANR